jgi:hypothetical protein
LFETKLVFRPRAQNKLEGDVLLAPETSRSPLRNEHFGVCYG